MFQNRKPLLYPLYPQPDITTLYQMLPCLSDQWPHLRPLPNRPHFMEPHPHPDRVDKEGEGDETAEDADADWDAKFSEKGVFKT